MPQVDTLAARRNPEDERSYSGRSFDGIHVTPFVREHRLPTTTSSAFENYRSFTSTSLRDLRIPPSESGKVLSNSIWVLEQIESGAVSAEDVLTEAIRRLLFYRNAWSITEQFRHRLESCPPGHRHFSTLESLGVDAFRFSFSSAGEHAVQRRTSDGRHRRDLLIPNPRQGTFWNRVAQRFDCEYAIVDFKNEANPVGPDSVEEVAKYTNIALGHFGVLVSRNGGSSAGRAAQLRLLRDRNICILVLSDSDLLRMVELAEMGGSPETVLEQRLNELLLDF